MDLSGEDGEQRAIFAEADQTGAILQQFGLSLDTSFRDFEHTRLTTLADVTGKPLKEIDRSSGLPWRQIRVDAWEVAIEAKRRIFERDIQAENARRMAGFNTGARCARCGGSGKLGGTKLVCPACKGAKTI